MGAASAPISLKNPRSQGSQAGDDKRMTEKARSSKLPYRPCVGVMLINRDGLVWIGRRADAPQSQAEGAGTWWQMPQGGIDEDEDPAKAAARELREETGVRSARIIAQSKVWHRYDLPNHLVGKAWGGRYRGQKQVWFLMRFTGPDREIDITPPNPEHIEFDAWRWARSSELLDLIVPFKRDVYRAVLDEFGPLIAPEG